MRSKIKIKSGTKHVKVSMKIDEMKDLMKGASNKSYQKSPNKWTLRNEKIFLKVKSNRIFWDAVDLFMKRQCTMH